MVPLCEVRPPADANRQRVADRTGFALPPTKESGACEDAPARPAIAGTKKALQNERPGALWLRDANPGRGFCRDENITTHFRAVVKTFVPPLSTPLPSPRLGDRGAGIPHRLFRHFGITARMNHAPHEAIREVFEMR